jgi:hypothetical protein
MMGVQQHPARKGRVFVFTIRVKVGLSGEYSPARAEFRQILKHVCLSDFYDFPINSISCSVFRKVQDFELLHRKMPKPSR